MMGSKAVEIAEKTAATVEKAALTTAGGTVVFGLTWNECAAIVGILATVIMTTVSVYCKFRYLRLAEQRAEFEHQDGEPDDD